MYQSETALAATHLLKSSLSRLKYKGDQLLGFAYFLGSYERVKNCQDLTVRGERFPQLYPPVQWIKSEMVTFLAFYA